MTSVNTFGIGSAEQFGGAVGNNDFYAPGDARVPKILGKTKKIKKRRKSRKSKIPSYIQTR